MTTARFQVIATLDGAGRLQKGTVEIDRETGDFVVRPYRRRRVYAMPLSVVAAMVCRSVITSELLEKRRARAEARKKAGR